MVNKIIILSGKGKGVVKLSGSATCVIEYYHRQPLDVFIHANESIIFKGVNSGEKLELPMNLGREISVLLLDNGEAVMHGSSQCRVDYGAIYRCYDLMCKRERTVEIVAKRELTLEFPQSDIEKKEKIIDNARDLPKDILEYSNSMSEAERLGNKREEIKLEDCSENLSIAPLTENNCASEPIAAVENVKENTNIYIGDIEYNFGTQDKNTDIINAKCCEDICTTQDELDLCEKVCNSRFDNNIDCQNEPFYVKIAAQLEELFDTYPCDNELEDIVHDSRWVRIPLDDDYYVVGVIQDDGEPLFICYGLPREERDANKCGVANHAEWLPLDRSEPNKRGYWIMYQNAITGENF